MSQGVSEFGADKELNFEDGVKYFPLLTILLLNLMQLFFVAARGQQHQVTYLHHDGATMLPKMIETIFRRRVSSVFFGGFLIYNKAHLQGATETL